MTFRILFLRGLMLIALCLPASAPAQAQKITEERERIDINQDALNLLANKRWGALDRMAEEYRQGFPATSGGTHKLTLIYAAFHETFSGLADDGPEELADEWIAARPKSPSAHITKAIMIGAHAGALRGSGPASSVDPDILPEYRKLLERSRQVLLDSKDIAQADPVWYVQMLVLARLQSDSGELERWLAEGTERFPDYQNIYLEAMQAALPKWGGSPEAVEKVARLAVEKTKAKTGYSLYAYVWYNAFSNQPELMGLLAQRQLVSWDDMLQGWKDRFNSYPDGWIRNGYLACACLAGDKQTFAEQLPLLQGQVNVVNRLWLPGLPYQQCVSRMR